LHGDTGGLCNLGVADAARHAVGRGLEIHVARVYVDIDSGTKVNYIIYRQGEKQGWPNLPRRSLDQPLANDPESRPLIKAALLDGLGQEIGAHDVG
jgi:hypothetical protein